MNRAQIEAAAIRVVEAMREKWVPNPETRYKTSTGNMAFNALQYRVEGDRFIVYINTDIAPYFPYTDEPWTAPRWDWKKNPNEGWTRRFADEFVRRFNAEIKGVVKNVIV